MTDNLAQFTLQRRSDGALLVELSGDWVVWRPRQSIAAIEKEWNTEGRPAALEFGTSGLGEWDSALVAFAFSCAEMCQRLGIPLKADALPPGVQRLIRLAQAVPEKKEARRSSSTLGLAHQAGAGVMGMWAAFGEAAVFIGEVVLGLTRLARRRAQFRWSDSLAVMQECGPEALGIVALINFLVGLILAFVGAVQLAQFGASIYVADLVAIAAVREMGCLMTAIILCGRTGAAFAAQLGTMKVNEEIDAFKTFGISTLEFLVLPRVIALVLMMPLLCVFADLIAILGGLVVSIGMLDVGLIEYVDRTIQAVTLPSFLLGIGKGACFGALIAMTGCFRGLRSGHSAAAVGLATTSAVVTGITMIIAADGAFAVICYVLGI